MRLSNCGALDVRLRHRIGSVELDMAFTLTQPWTVLFAPSGAGKTTVLRVLAGLARPQVGRVVWTGPGAGPEVVLTDTERGVWVAPHRREVRFVGQQASLFPHRTVLENVVYGLSGKERAEGERVEALLRLCRIEALRGKMPGMLSGGERQRVALARAVAPTRCRLLLLDEPFSALDLAMREEVLAGLREWLGARQIPVLQVTHDVSEACSLGVEVIRMKDGSVAKQGPAVSVLREEREWLSAKLSTVGSAEQR